MLSFLFISCEQDRLKIDVSGSDLRLDIKRWDKALLPIDTANTEVLYSRLLEDFDSFAPLYLGYMLQTQSPSTPECLYELRNDPVYPLTLQIQDGINQMESEVLEQEEKLNSGFKHFQHYFPEKPIPEIVFMNSWFQYGVFTTDSILAVGLDFFVVDTALHRLYPPQFYGYMKKDMHPQFLAVNAMYGWLYNQIYPFSGDESTLLDHMVHKGKVRYLLEAMFPEESEAIIMNYTENELAWCYKKQLAVWRELTKVREAASPLLYETKKSEISKWVAPAPFTSSLSEEATDRIGEWIGLQIVRDFMRENPEVSVVEMLEKNPRKLLKTYNPKN